MFDLAQISGGGFYQIVGSDLPTFWTSLTESFYSSTWATYGTYANCANINQYIQVGSNSSLLTIDIFGIDPPTISVMNPNGIENARQLHCSARLDRVIVVQLFLLCGHIFKSVIAIF